MIDARLLRKWESYLCCQGSMVGISRRTLLGLAHEEIDGQMVEWSHLASIDLAGGGGGGLRCVARRQEHTRCAFYARFLI